MKRTLLCLTVIALAGACKKPADTKPPEGTDTVTQSGDPKPADTAPTVVQEPDPPAIAEGREHFMLGHFDKAKELLTPLTEDLKTRQQLRASGLSAAWLALSVVDPVAEDAHAPAEHAVAMGEQTGDKEVQIVAKLALGAYQLGMDDDKHAAANFEEAYKLQTDGPNAGLALVLYGQAKVNMAFGGEEKEQLAHPEELDSAASTFTKAQRLAASQPGNEMIAARALTGLASVANYKKSLKEACSNAAEAGKLYTAKKAGQPLMERVNAIIDAAKCPNTGS